jgi:hypothetical protein
MGLDKLAAQFFSGCKTGNMRRKLLAIVVLLLLAIPCRREQVDYDGKGVFSSLPVQCGLDSRAVVSGKSVASVPMGGGRKGTHSIRLLEARPGLTRFSFELGDYSISATESQGREFSVVNAPGMWHSAVKGAPSLPVSRVDIALSSHSSPRRFTLVSVDEFSVPCSPPLPSCGQVFRKEVVQECLPDPLIYDGQGMYPEDVLAESGSYQLREVAGIGVTISPFRYDFARGEMVVTRRFVAELTEDACVEYGEYSDIWDFRCIQASRFLNGGMLRGGSDGTKAGTLLYVVPTAWAGAIGDLVSWKRNQGYEVIVGRYPDDTGASNEDLKSYLASLYASSGLSHVVLVGDADAVPPFQEALNPNDPPRPPYPIGDDDNLPQLLTDIPYSHLAGDDIYSDVFLSRLPVVNVDDLPALSGKLIGYDHASDLGAEWRMDGVFVASADKGDTGIAARKADSYFIGNAYAALVSGDVLSGDLASTIYERQTPMSAIGTSLSGGASVMFYLGHGYSNRWKWFRKKEDYLSTQARQLRNGLKLPFVGSFACSTGNFSYTLAECLGSSLVLNSSGGAIGVICATSETSWNPPIYSLIQLSADCVNRFGTGRLTTQGGLAWSSIHHGIEYLQTTSDTGQGNAKYYSYQMHLLGDCSLMSRIGGGRAGACIRSMNHFGEYVFSVSWSDGESVPGAIVHLRTADGLWSRSGCTDGDGVFTVKVPRKDDMFFVTVSDPSFGVLTETFQHVELLEDEEVRLGFLPAFEGTYVLPELLVEREGVEWFVVPGGELPSGMRLEASGKLVGAVMEPFEVELVVRTGLGEAAVLLVKFYVAERHEFTLELRRGWNYVSSPLRALSLSGHEGCIAFKYREGLWIGGAQVDESDFQSLSGVLLHASTPRLIVVVGGELNEPASGARHGWIFHGVAGASDSPGNSYELHRGSFRRAAKHRPGVGYFSFVR